MPCCTYLDNHNKNQKLHNKELSELLEKLREKTGEDWQIIERSFTKSRLFRKPVTIYRYQLLYPVCGIEYQVINFYRDDDTFWNGISVSAELVAAYIYGRIGA